MRAARLSSTSTEVDLHTSLSSLSWIVQLSFVRAAHYSLKLLRLATGLVPVRTAADECIAWTDRGWIQNERTQVYLKRALALYNSFERPSPPSSWSTTGVTGLHYVWTAIRIINTVIICI